MYRRVRVLLGPPQPLLSIYRFTQYLRKASDVINGRATFPYGEHFRENDMSHPSIVDTLTSRWDIRRAFDVRTGNIQWL